MKAQISIVEDDQAVRDALKRMLQSHGYTTAVFDSAEQFLASGASNAASCLILDIRMPGMSGIALLESLVSRGCRTPTILVTALPTTGERRRALARGAVSYLAKPLSEQVLLDSVRAALENGGPAITPSVSGQVAPRL